MSTRSTEPAPRTGLDGRYTVMIVPEGGRGRIWQRSIPLRRVRQVVAGVATVAVAALVWFSASLATLPRVVAHDALVGENLALKTRLDEVSRRVSEIEPLVTRVRAYDEQLRSLEARNALPGFGPVDQEELAARQDWIDAVVPARTRAEPIESEEVEAHLAALEDDLHAIGAGLDDYEDMLARFDGVQSALPKLWPVEGVLTSRFGYRIAPFTGRWTMHTGLDLGAPYGSPILATNEGLVVFADWHSGHGRTVEIEHGHDVTTRYCHASRLLVAPGDIVQAGDVIALVGSTGMSTGPHLHFELMLDGEKVDPLQYLP